MKQLFALPLTALAAACMTYPPPPPILPGPPGSAYRALGTEPFWDLTIDPARMVFTDRGNNVVVTQPTPRVIVGFAGEIYQTPRLGVNIVHQPCSDGMSDRTYRDRVQVTVDGRLFNGCGGDVIPAATLANTRWRVMAVNGLTPPADSNYRVSFDATRLSAGFGCNGMSADYRQDGELLTVGHVVQTERSCPDMRFEGAAVEVLRQPLRLTWAGSDRLRLSSGPQRTIDLIRSY